MKKSKKKKNTIEISETEMGSNVFDIKYTDFKKLTGLSEEKLPKTLKLSLNQIERIDNIESKFGNDVLDVDEKSIRLKVDIVHDDCVKGNNYFTADLEDLNDKLKQIHYAITNLDMSKTRGISVKESRKLNFMQKYLNSIIDAHNKHMGYDKSEIIEVPLVEICIIETDNKRIWSNNDDFGLPILKLPINYKIDNGIYRIDIDKGEIEIVLCGTSGIYCKLIKINDFPSNVIINFERADFIPYNFNNTRINHILYDCNSEEYVLLCSTGIMVKYKIDFKNIENYQMYIVYTNGHHNLICGYHYDGKYYIRTMDGHDIIYDTKLMTSTMMFNSNSDRTGVMDNVINELLEYLKVK